MDGHRIRVPIALCDANDLHFIRRGLIPLDKYLQEISECLNPKGFINRRILERAVLAEVKIAGLLKGIYRITDLRRRLLEHKRWALNAKILPRKRWVEETRKVKNITSRLNPTVKIFAVIGGALVPCKGNDVRLRYAYSEGPHCGASITNLVFFSEQPLTHDAEENALPDEATAFRENQASSSVRDALKIGERDDRRGAIHVMPNAIVSGLPRKGETE